MRALLSIVALSACSHPESSGASAATARATAHQGTSVTLRFDAGKPGELPESWQVGGVRAGPGNAGWQLCADASAPSQPQVLMVAPRGASGSPFNRCWTDSIAFRDGEIEVALRAVGGTEDQGGGPMWRVRDAANYYVCRFNPLERNFRVYVVAEGERRQLGSVEVEASPTSWHKIRVEHVGPRLRCWLDGAAELEVHDSTLLEAGGVGVWSKADAATHFDDLMIRTR